MDELKFKSSLKHYDINGKEISFEEYLKLGEDNKYRIVGRDTLANGIYVSTVWLGMDHSFLQDTKPVIFESMAFGLFDEIDCRRYSSLDDALKGHAEMVEKFAPKGFLVYLAPFQRWFFKLAKPIVHRWKRYRIRRLTYAMSCEFSKRRNETKRP